MAGGVNKVILVGNLGADPEVRTFGNGDQVANLRVATSESWKDSRTGEKREKVEWHSVAIFGGLVRVVERYARKGSKLYLEGKLETRKWQDRDGKDRYTTEIVLRPYAGTLELLGDPRGQGDGSGYGGGSGGYGGGAGPDAGAGSGGAGQRQDMDDEIPF